MSPRGSAPAPKRLLADGAKGVEDQLVAKLLSEIRPPRLDSVTLERNWRRIASAPVGARPSWRFLLVPMALALAVASGFFLRRAQHPRHGAEVIAASGGVFFSPRAEIWRPGASGQELAEGEHLRTESSGRVLIRVAGVATVLVDKDSDVTFEQTSGGSFLRLARGSMVVKVSKRPPGEPFVVVTDRYAVRVVGTLFSVAQSPGDGMEVSVREGAVVVLDGATKVVDLAAGSRWTSDGTSHSPIDSIDLSDDAVGQLLKSVLVGGATERWSHEDLGRLGRYGTAPQAPPPTAPAPVIMLHDQPASVAGGPRLSNRAGVALPPAPSGIAPPQPVAENSPTGAIASARSPLADVPPYQRGLALEAAGEDLSAAEQLARAVDLDPQHSELALYSLGRLRLRRLADPEGALSAFRRYQTKYPSGTLRPEVDLSIVEIEANLGRHAEALQESDRFLRSYPENARALEVRRLRAGLLRATGDCRAALREYATLGEAERDDDSSYAVAYCHGVLGQSSDAQAALRAYLAHFPDGAHRADARQALDDLERKF